MREGDKVDVKISEIGTLSNTITGYMGLIKQIDDNLGRLFEFMKTNKLFDNTMIVFTSDHGDYLGDHWLGEKELFHEQSVRVPLIIYDPSKTANLTRGRREKKLVESIDLLPTFLEALSCSTSTHRLEGNSLIPILQDKPVPVPDPPYVELFYQF